jgi:hypothetical protein
MGEVEKWQAIRLHLCMSSNVSTNVPFLGYQRAASIFISQKYTDVKKCINRVCLRAERVQNGSMTCSMSIEWVLCQLCVFPVNRNGFKHLAPGTGAHRVALYHTDTSFTRKMAPGDSSVLCDNQFCFFHVHITRERDSSVFIVTVSMVTVTSTFTSAPGQCDHARVV